MDKEYIVTISEGEIAEKKIIKNIQDNFFNESTKKELIILPFKTNIYALYNTLKRDDFETDIIEVLIEKNPSIKEKMKGINKRFISQIFLFFDYDGHAYKSEEVENIISTMLEFFNNETEQGKMYISYPMVEAIKDLKKNDVCSRRCFVKAKVNIQYKSLVAIDSDFRYLRKLKLDDWYLILSYNLKKANCIVSSSFMMPAYNIYQEAISQKSILENQIKKFTSINETIAVISGFALFLIDYFGETLYNIINSAVNRNDEVKSLCYKTIIHE